MNDITQRKIKTGGDPRTLPDYAALRDELNKLTHPARPDVNWQYVEKLCLLLFEQNGVDLQTAAWYTLARTQLVGLFGLNEGLAILEALVSHQWGVFWPQPVHARMEILSSLSHRLQQRMRSLLLNYSDLSELYQAEQRLTVLGEVLQRLELKHLSQLDTLRNLMHNNAVRLENSEGATGAGSTIQTGIELPATAISGPTDSAGRSLEGECGRKSAMKWVYIAQPEHQTNVDVPGVMPAPVRKWTSFLAGMSTMLVMSAVAVWGWQYLHRPDPLLKMLEVSLAPLPATLTPEQLHVIRQQPPSSQTVIAQTQQQLARLEKLPPDWNIVYSRKLIEQVQWLWPEKTGHLIQQWQQLINVSMPSADELSGWHEGMAQLQALADKLDALDGQKGKYITVSELKSQVFGMMTSFRKTVPVEEQFRLLIMQPDGSPLQRQQIRQVEQQLKVHTYMLNKEKQRD